MTNNGTISLTLIALALGFSKGDEIIVPNYTMIATANSIKLIGAKPVFVDVEEDTLCLDLKLLKNKKKNLIIMLVSLAQNQRWKRITLLDDYNYTVSIQLFLNILQTELRFMILFVMNYLIMCSRMIQENL